MYELSRIIGGVSKLVQIYRLISIHQTLIFQRSFLLAFMWATYLRENPCDFAICDTCDRDAAKMNYDDRYLLNSYKSVVIYLVKF